MKLDGASITPAEGKVAVTFVDDEDDAPATAPGQSVPYEGVLAVVAAIGAKVNGIKKGDTVVMRPWAREGLKVGDKLFICDAYDVVATID